jgi:hypothetical protein
MTTETKTPTQPAKPPITKIRVGLITASIWERLVKEKPFYTVTFERRYKTTNGEWKTSHGYDAAGLAELRMAASLAHDKVLELFNSGA